MRANGETGSRGGRAALRCVKNTVVSVGSLAATFFLCLMLNEIDQAEHSDIYVSMLFILAILLIARMTDGYLYGILSSLVGVLAINYIFTYPYFAFNFILPGYPITALCMLAAATLTSALTTRTRREEQLRSEAEYEKNRSNLLRAISHDIRTPLTSILGANSALMESGAAMTGAQRDKLHREIEDDAQWLLRMVENLLTITRFRGEGERRIEKTPEMAEEVLAEAVDKFHRHFPDHSVSVSVPAEPVLCPMDAMLIEQVLINLLENAAVHAAGATAIEMSADVSGGNAVFTVADDGCGVPRERLKRLFEGGDGGAQGDAGRNMGIGLSVCRTIVRAHGGAMHAENRSGGGLRVWFTLPLERRGDEQS